MLSAFTARPLVELKQRDKSKVESVLAYGDRLLVGLNSGSLRIYRVNDASEEEHREDEDERPKSAKKPVDLLREVEKFSKYKIEQLALVKEAELLVSLSNAHVHLHDLSNYTLKETLSKSKGASTFAINSSIVKDATTNVGSVITKLAVAVKRKLLIWTWRDGELEENIFDHTFVTGIKSLMWVTDSRILVGLGASYVILDIGTSNVIDIVGPGSIGGAAGQDGGRLGATGVASISYLGMSAPKPLATKLGEGEMLLARDINTHFVDLDGNALGRRQIPWPVAPEAVGYSHPYLVTLQAGKGTLEVRNPQTLTLLQSISLLSASQLHIPQPSIHLAHANRGFFAHSERAVWWLDGKDHGNQVDVIIKREAYDEAISLIGMLDEKSLGDKELRMRNVKMQKAQALFEDHKYRESIDLFTEVNAPPERVISFYPPPIAGGASAFSDGKSASKSPLAMSPKSGKSKSEDRTDDSGEASESQRKPSTDKKDGIPELPVPTEPLEGQDLKTATEELRGFLVQSRTRMKNVLNPDGTVRKEGRNESGTTDLSSLLTTITSDQARDQEKLLETAKLIDTTLFRAYMSVSPGFVGPLFRIDNFCDPDVVNEKLTKAGRFNDLVDFFYGKKLHRQALELLERFGDRKVPSEEAPKLAGPQRTVSYLQNLPPEQIDLILEFSKWPLQKDPDLGMDIFLADTENAETLPRDRVLAFLSSISSDLSLRYLEHIIEDLNDTTPTFHHQLAETYILRLKESRPFPTEQARSDWESKTLSFLRTSKGYTPYKLLSQLPLPSTSKPSSRNNEATLDEARALVLSTMGQHKQALSIYVFNLASPEKAEDYCNAVFLSSLPASSSTTAPHASANDDSDTTSIYHLLLSLYLSPPPPHKPNWPAALSLLAHHGARMPAASTLSLIPDSLSVKEMESYFLRQIRSQKSAANEGRVVAGLRAAEAFREEGRLRLGDEFMGMGGEESGFDNGGTVGGKGSMGNRGRNKGRNRRVVVEEERVCGVCFRRFGGSAVKVTPENGVVHYGCSLR